MKLYPSLSKYTYQLLSLFLVSSTTLFSQGIDEIVDTTTVVSKPVKNDSIIKTANDTLQIKDSITVIPLEMWDTTRFNPYKNQHKTFPFQIKFSDSTYASPVKGKKVITSRYGWRRGRPHKGIDIDLVTGDHIMALFDGVVRFARYSSGHGKTIVIRHFNGLETAYAHLSKYKVKANDTIKKGQIIGVGGTTGNARGSHLHLVISYKGNYINPEYLFDFGKENKLRKQQVWVTKHWTTAHFHSSKRQSELTYYKSYEDALANHKAQSKKRIHIVRKGDTLSHISNTYRVSLMKLCKSNAISMNSILKIGKKLIIY